VIHRTAYVLVACGDSRRGSAIVEELEQQGMRAFWCATAREALIAPRPDVLISSLDLPDHDGLELCEALGSSATPIASILLCDEGSIDIYRRAMHLGVQDLCDQSASPASIAESAEKAVEVLWKQGPDSAFQATIQSTSSACEQVQRNLSAWLLVRGIAPSTRCRIATALGEGLANAVRHAYPGDIGPIEIEARLHDRDVEVSIRDRGEGMTEAEKFNATDTEIQGGFTHMCALSEDLSLATHANLGTHVGMRFSAHRTHFDEDQRTDFEDFDFLGPDHVRALLDDIESPNGHEIVHLSPALAVTIGRLLAGPSPDRFLATGI
jgi:DNA-binding NarL/FixJ family response regulator